MRTTFIYLDYRRRTSLAHGLLRVNKWLGYLRDAYARGNLVRRLSTADPVGLA
jgi:hypothetical protein